MLITSATFSVFSCGSSLGCAGADAVLGPAAGGGGGGGATSGTLPPHRVRPATSAVYPKRSPSTSPDFCQATSRFSSPRRYKCSPWTVTDSCIHTSRASKAAGPASGPKEAISHSPRAIRALRAVRTRLSRVSSGTAIPSATAASSAASPSAARLCKATSTSPTRRLLFFATPLAIASLCAAGRAHIAALSTRQVSTTNANMSVPSPWGSGAPSTASASSMNPRAKHHWLRAP
mmetsp:Transcript_66332/g.176995  ORF Transcript_66332/g.176995 Transcript_66332/m.176995 type:complete len:233 (-) Transcript_66332:900-1598(-)